MTLAEQTRYCPRCGRETHETVCDQDGSPTFLLGHAAPNAGSPDIGDVIADRYRIKGVLGRGGFGAVFAAEHLTTGQRVAIKVMIGGFASSPELLQRFLREAKVTASLSHPNTVRIYDFGQTRDGVVFMAMEHLRGPPLDAHLKTVHSAQTALSQSETVHIGIQVLRSLTEAHEAGLVHRDLKPGNLILVPMIDEPPMVKVLDFGIARAEDSELTQTGTALGTPLYMSPEQARGERPDGRSDLYSLGCILFACVSGQAPFEGDSAMSILLAHQLTPLPDLRTIARVPISDDFVACVQRATAKSVNDRFANALEMRKALEAVTPPTAVATSPHPGVSGFEPTLEADVISDERLSTGDRQAVAARQRMARAIVSAPTMAHLAASDGTATRESDIITGRAPAAPQPVPTAPRRASATPQRATGHSSRRLPRGDVTAAQPSARPAHTAPSELGATPQRRQRAQETISRTSAYRGGDHVVAPPVVAVPDDLESGAHAPRSDSRPAGERAAPARKGPSTVLIVAGVLGAACLTVVGVAMWHAFGAVDGASAKPAPRADATTAAKRVPASAETGKSSSTKPPTRKLRPSHVGSSVDAGPARILPPSHARHDGEDADVGDSQATADQAAAEDAGAPSTPHRVEPPVTGRGVTPPGALLQPQHRRAPKPEKSPDKARKAAAKSAKKRARRRKLKATKVAPSEPFDLL